jgi:hypothetical protein
MKRGSIHPVVRLLILLAFVVMPWAASAQETRHASRATAAAAYRPSAEDEVDVQLRRRLGTFGFANSLYDKVYVGYSF